MESSITPKKLKADNIHKFKNLANKNGVNYIKLEIYPDGGVSRLRVFGRLK